MRRSFIKILTRRDFHDRSEVHHHHAMTDVTHDGEVVNETIKAARAEVVRAPTAAASWAT